MCEGGDAYGEVPGEQAALAAQGPAAPLASLAEAPPGWQPPPLMPSQMKAPPRDWAAVGAAPSEIDSEEAERREREEKERKEAKRREREEAERREREENERKEAKRRQQEEAEHQEELKEADRTNQQRPQHPAPRLRAQVGCSWGGDGRACQ